MQPNVLPADQRGPHCGDVDPADPGGIVSVLLADQRGPHCGMPTSPGMSSCTTVGSKSIPKTRVLADLGITAGAFHRYIYKPIKGGTFTGASKAQKVLILGKGAVAAGAIAHFLGNAIDNPLRRHAVQIRPEHEPDQGQAGSDGQPAAGRQHLGGRLHQQLVQHAAAPDRVHPQRQRHRPRR